MTVAIKDVAMSSTEVPDPDVVQPVHPHQDDTAKRSFAEAERTHADEKGEVRPPSVDEIEEARKGHGHADYGKIDKELAKYAAGARVDISLEESARLRKLIDKRVLLVMILTYFIQAVDKGTISFAAIMGLPEQTGLADENGKPTQEWSWLTSCIYITILIVEYPQVSVRFWLYFSSSRYGT